jgi:hypothetical protein
MAINHIQMLRYIQTSDAEAKKLSEQNLKVSETNLEVSQKLHRLTTIATVAAVAATLAAIIQAANVIAQFFHRM